MRQPKIMMDSNKLGPEGTPLSPSEVPSRISLLSSNYTLFWRIFLPIFSTVFLIGLLVAFYLTEEDEMVMPLVPLSWARTGIVLVLAAWIFLLYRTLWRLKRVDADGRFVYITNYWTTVRYPWEDIACFQMKNTRGTGTWRLELKAKGRFGQVIYFFPSAQTAHLIDVLGHAYLIQTPPK